MKHFLRLRICSRNSCSNCTLLELKLSKSYPVYFSSSGSNCTLLELKLRWLFLSSVAAKCSNCTLLELKPNINTLQETVTKRSNCTLLELKLANKEAVKLARSVQIVPCWNWNLFKGWWKVWKFGVQIVPCWNWNVTKYFRASRSQMFKLYLAGIETSPRIFSTLDAQGSNCTLLELKHRRVFFYLNSWHSSNCTLLELKLRKRTKIRMLPLFKLYLAGIETLVLLVLMIRFSVQIVPCWNWNELTAPETYPPTCSNCTLLELKRKSAYWSKKRKNVQIVPCWNWNHIMSSFRCPRIRSNCTLLELKLFANGSRRALTSVQIAPYWNWNMRP